MPNSRKVLIGILATSVLIRVIIALILGDQVIELPGTADQLSYHTLALRVLGGYGFSFGQGWWPVTPAGAPTAHWSYLYTLFLVFVYALFGPHPIAARIIQAVLVGLLQPYLTYHLGKRVFNQTAGLIGAAFTTLYAYFIYYTGALMTEPFFITAILGIFFYTFRLLDELQKPNASSRSLLVSGVLLGAVSGAAILLRQLILFFVPILLVWIILAANRQKSLKRSLIGVVTALGVVAILILPITLYNYSRFGRLVLLNTNSGYAFFWANNPFYGTHFIPILTDQQYVSMIPADLRSLDEAALDQALMKRGLEYVSNHPKDFFLLSLSRIPVYFMFWPSADSGLISNITRVGSFGIAWPFMLAGLILAGLGLKGSLGEKLLSPVVLLMLFVGIYSIIHIFSWTLIRYRLPVDAILLIFAGQVCAVIFAWLGVQRFRFGKA